METAWTVVIASALVGGISAALAALLLLAEKYVANYGACTIDINEGAKRFEITGGNTLLGTLREQGIFIPSACGGRGTCAYCKVRIRAGGGPTTPTEEPLLTGEERGSDVRISCQVKVRNDLSILIPEELFNVKEFRGVMERIRDLTYDIKELRIRLAEPETIEFTPGQYVQLETPAYGDNPEPVYRAYSMSSPPSDNRFVELMVRLVPQGICTTWVHTILKEGLEVAFSAPYGQFRLSDSGREMIWIAGGSGMAPFWSMICHMKEKNIERLCTYFFGAVKKRDLFLLEELSQLEKELSWFHFIPALSAPEEGDEWSGEKGLITEVVGRHLQDGSDKEAYLCGSPGMIDASIGVLRSKGVTEERIFYDKFA